jgi:CRP-like cAMP-binding protein
LRGVATICAPRFYGGKMIESPIMVKKKTSVKPEILLNFPFFASFSMDQLEEIAETAEKAQFKRGQIVFKQGDLSETMYLILKGIVKIEREDEDGQLFEVGEKTENEIFGELAMLSKEARQATVTVVKDLDVLGSTEP